ncbi:MAG: polysaccharide deacetylase family protein [Thermaerobacter sp.]|nr:polysaccharide deacetylase family protein [Thermaerobacter sp.]
MFLFVIVFRAIAALTQGAVPQTTPPPVISRVPVQDKRIAFTFDDGPNVRFTPQFIALLKSYDAHATFFLIGYEAQQNPQIIRQLNAAGMEIANHGMRHRYLRSDNPELATQEVREGERAILSAGVSRPSLYRLPGGISGPRTRSAVGALGYRIIGWSIDPRDSIRGTSSTQITQTVLRHAAPGTIVLMHDGPATGREPTLAALRHIIPALEAKGYKICSVGELLRTARAAS